MKHPNIIQQLEPDKATEWDSLREVPFSGEIDSPLMRKKELKQRFTDIRAIYEKKQVTPETLMLIVFGAIQSLLIGIDIGDKLEKYEDWVESLGEIRPIIFGYWAECDPMIKRYLFMVFVAQFVAILKLWGRVDYARICIPDCAMLGEFFIENSMMSADMLDKIVQKWGVSSRRK